MAGAKIVVIYPRPTDTQEFDREYTERHLPMALESFAGLVKLVPTKIVGTPTGDVPAFYRIAELSFRSMDDLKKAAGSSSAGEAVQHAVSISTGGAPIFLVAEEEEALTP